MNDDHAQRRLAAILATDVVGFSRLMGVDEEGTLRTLTALNSELVEPCIARHRGRIFKTTGDGLLAEFASVVDAVQCAVTLQESLRDQAAPDSGSAQIEFRMGVNLGDIIVQGSDVYGDGVNIAARLEGICEPGSVYVSGTVHDHAAGKLPVSFEDLGEQSVKNIARPVRIYRAQPSTLPSNSAAASSETAASPTVPVAVVLPERPSIAVLAFDNMSGDPEQSYFAEGISEDIITDLSKISGLMVIARNSSFAYRGQSIDLRKVCEELNVRYILEGSVRRAGNRVRINAQMIDGSNGGHLWADRYDREIEDIFAVQDEVTREIVSALQIALTAGEEKRRSGRRKVDPEAYDLLIRARDRLYQFRAPLLAEARTSLERVVEIDPEIAEAWALMSLIHSTEHMNGWNPDCPDHLAKAIEFATQGCDIDPEEPWAFHALALANMWRRTFDAAERAIETALQLNPNFAAGYGVKANIKDFTGDHETAVACAEKGLALDPHYDIAMQVLARSQFALGRYAEAAANFERRLVAAPKSDMSRAFLASAYGHLGQADSARQRWDEIIEINADFLVSRIRDVLPYTSTSVYERLVDGLGKANIVSG